MNKIRLYIWNSKASATDKWKSIQGVVQNSLQDEITLDESYDNATVKAINKDSSMCDAFSKFYVSVGEFGTEKRYYIGSEKVARIQMSDYYEHTYTLIEPTKLLERYKLFGLSVTQPLTGTKKTLRDVCNRAFKDVYEKYGVSFIIDSDVDLSDVCPEFSVTNKTTLFEFLYNNIGKKIGAMPRLLGDSSAVYNVITFDSFSNLRLSSDIIRTNGYEKDIDEENACNFLEAEVSNLVVENDKNEISLTYPPYPYFITVRSDTVRLEDDNAIIRLPYNIKKIIKLYIKDGHVEVDTTAGNGYVASISGYEISSRIVTEDEWLSLEENPKDKFENVGEKTKNDTLYYTVGSNEIKNLSKSYKTSAWTEAYPLSRVLASAYLDKYKGKEISYRLTSDHTQRTGYLISTRRSSSVPSPKEVEFRIEYIPYIDTITNQVNPIGEQKGSLTFNQNAENVNAQELGNAMCNDVQNQNSKTILQTELIDTKSDYWSKIKNIGDIIDGNVITSVKRRFTGSKYIEVLYSSSESFIKKSLYIQENREYRPYAIPSKTVVDRHILTNEFCIIDYIEQRKSSSNFQDVMLDYMQSYLCFNKDDWKNWSNDKFRKQSQISSVLFKTISKNNKEIGYFLLPCTAIALGKSVQFDWTTLDNYSAGKYIVNADAEVPTVRDAPYSFNGEFNNFEIILRSLLENYYAITDNDIYNDGDYDINPNKLPYYQNSDGNFIQLVDELNIYKKYYQVDKDAGEKIKGSIQLHFSTLQNDIVISNYFAENCPFVKLPKTNFYFCCLNKSVNKYTEKISTENIITQEKITSANVFYSNKNIYIDATTFTMPTDITSNMSWALIDYDSLENGFYKIAFGGSLEKLITNNKQIVLSFTSSI